MTDRVVMLSFWRNDADKGIVQRVQHLLDKPYKQLRFVWVVGDSTDATEIMLRELAELSERDVTVIRHDTGILADTPNQRLKRLSETCNAGLDVITDDDDWLLVHESDLISPGAIVKQLLAVDGDVTAGWVTLGEGGMFYDTYAYRRGGNMMSNSAERPDAPFEMDSVGSVWLAPAAPFVDGLRAQDWAVIDIMRQLCELGLRIVVDPSIDIIQPVQLWESRGHADG